MENNPELSLAWQFIENTGTHLFLTGKAGTGKTTFLRRLREQSPKRMVVLAPTGIAAINAGGMTIHSFFQLSFAPFVPDTTFSAAQTPYRFGKEKRRIIRSMDLLVIDEISMVRADLLDAVDAALRRYRDREKPFGGVQLLLIGDLQQLAPVVKETEWELLKSHYETPYFFASRALRSTTYVTIELEKVYRQSDAHFLSLLNKIRENCVDDQVLAELNKCYQPHFRPRKEEGYIRLTTHNARAQQVNDRELASLPGREYTFRAQTEGTFPEYAYPADERLRLKVGAQIMFLKNDTSAEKRYYNGMIGEVLSLSSDSILVRGNGQEQGFKLQPEEWTSSKYVLNEETKEITEEIEGIFRQYPVRLAWAITIHKSQGLTFERAIIDAHHSFAHGQTYVALSRCKSLEGLVLESPLRASSVICDRTVEDFTEEMGRNKPGEQQLNHSRQAYFLDLLNDLFGFHPLEQAFRRLLRLMDEDLYRLYPRQLAAYKELAPRFKEGVLDVSVRFRQQYMRMVEEDASYASSSALQERIRSGAAYFGEVLAPFRTLYDKTEMPVDNKELQKKLAERMQTYGELLILKETLLNSMAGEVFTVGTYLRQKAKAMLQFEENKNTTTGKRAAKQKDSVSRSGGKEKIAVPTDVLHPNLYRTLVLWRSEKARKAGLPAYIILQQKALLAIVNLLPETAKELERVPYFGAKGREKYGVEILEMVCAYIRGKETDG